MATHLGSTGLGIYIDQNNIQYTSNQQIVLDLDRQDATLSLSNLRLTGIPTPIATSDAVSKGYVDSTPFIQLYATTLPAINDPLTTHWASIQSNILEFTNNNIQIPIGIYKIRLKVTSNHDNIILGICKGSVTTFLSNQAQYQQLEQSNTLEFLYQATSADYFNVYVIHKQNNENLTQTVQLIVLKV